MDNDKGTHQKRSTEIDITKFDEHDFNKLGFLPIYYENHYKRTPFRKLQTIQKPHYPIFSRLPYIMCISRIAHYLKIITRNKVNECMNGEDIEKYLQQWINRYTNEYVYIRKEGSVTSDMSLEARYPIEKAHIRLSKNPYTNAYLIVAYIYPYLQTEEITVGSRFVAKVPILK